MAKIKRLLKRFFRKETHMKRALKKINGQLYVEIGVRAGECFNQIKSPEKIGIDPYPDGFGENLKPGESFYKMESNDFFTNYAEKIFENKKIDVALVDGLHEFKQALQDILNLEKYMAPNGIIFIHDCNPPTPRHAGEAYGGDWNGDVWKAAYYLTTYRKDLKFFTLNCDWGVGVLSGFNNASEPPISDSKIIEKCKLLDYDVLDKNRKKILHLKPVWYSYLGFNYLFSFKKLFK